MATTYTGLLQLPKHEVTDPFDITLINDMADRVDAGVAKAYRGKAAHNLLDNSDGSRFVAQAGLGGSHGTTAYAGDRWMLDRGSISGTSNDDGSYRDIFLAAGSRIQQIIANQDLLYGKAWTAAVWLADGTVVIASGPINGAATADWETPIGSLPVNGVSVHVQAGSGTDLRYRFLVSADADTTILAMALIPGAYTADTLPEYQSKGYTAELMECQRYYQWINVFLGADDERTVTLPMQMRIPQPTVTYTAGDGLGTINYAMWNANTLYIKNVGGYRIAYFAICADL